MKYIISQDLLQLGVRVAMFQVDVRPSEIENIGDAVHCEFFINKTHFPIWLEMIGL